MESDDETTLLTPSSRSPENEADSTSSSNVTSADSERRRSRRLSGKPPLERVDEVQSQDGERKRSTCPDYFGVKSYLHFFYDPAVIKDPSIYEEDESGFLFLNPRPRRSGCRSIWWKIFVWIGANLLVFGIIGILISYLLPRRPIEVLEGDSYRIVNTEAIRYNHNLDLCKLVSSVVFCLGGLTLIVSLLFPSFLYHYCDESRRDSEGFKVNLLHDEKPPLSPIEMTVPATSKLQNVQPVRKSDEAIMTQEGSVSFKE